MARSVPAVGGVSRGFAADLRPTDGLCAQPSPRPLFSRVLLLPLLLLNTSLQNPTTHDQRRLAPTTSATAATSTNAKFSRRPRQHIARTIATASSNCTADTLSRWTTVSSHPGSDDADLIDLAPASPLPTRKSTCPDPSFTES